MSIEKKKLLSSVYIPFILLLIMWVVKFVELGFNVSFSWFGVHPLEIVGLPGIFLSPLLHGDINHLMANSVSFFVLAVALFYFYRDISLQVFIGIWLLSGIWIWFGGQEGSVHIGASSLIYGLSAFLFFSGAIRKDTRMAALALIVAFLYGSIIWGVFPDFFPKENISWEGHLGGFVSGIILAFYYKNSGPKRKRYSWEFDDEDSEEEDENAYWKTKNKDTTS